MSDERVERRLAAVLAADIAGYSRLMGADEEGTLARLKAIRKTLVDLTIAAHRGRIVKTTGDGMLVEFSSAVDATRCAVQVQRQMQDQHGNVAQEKRIEFRIGIHVGDIIFDDNDIFGDGVNIAARLEGIAEPGGVCMSDDAYRQVRGKVEIACDDLGLRALKNIAEPMRAWRVQFDDRGAEAAPRIVAATSSPPLALPDKPSIAVLPFQNMSGDPEQEYFADGMVEDIITALSRFKSLFVIARNSSFTYKGKAVDIKQVGRELGVRYVLEGSVRKAGNRVRITGQLIDATTGSHLWADKFDGNLENIFDLQDEITDNVVIAISPKIQQSEFERAKRKPTESLNAYDYYLRGLAKMSQYKREPVEQALSLYRKAIDIDADFALPYAASAFWYGVWMTFGWSTNRVQDAANSIALARKALELDSDDATILTYSGYMLAYHAHELDEASALIERATKANPNLATAWNYRGWVNVNLSNHRDAIGYFENALRLSPLDPLVFTTHIGIGTAHFYLGDFAEASRWIEVARRENPEFLGTLRIAMACHALSGRMDEARATWEVARRIDPSQRLSNTKQRFALRRAEDMARLIEGFRLAGMPD